MQGRVEKLCSKALGILKFSLTETFNGSGLKLGAYSTEGFVKFMKSVTEYMWEFYLKL